MSQLTLQEQKIMDLFDAGLNAHSIARRTGFPLSSIAKTISQYSYSFASDRRHEAAMSRGSATLLRGLRAAGGHR